MTKNKDQQEGWMDSKERELLDAILKLETKEEAERFFLDLCTPAELRALADRWRVAKLLDQEMPYRRIYEQTGVSTATVTRVARALLYGERGYRTMLDRTAKADSSPSKKEDPHA